MAATKLQQAAIDLYAEIMEEEKARLSSIDQALSGSTGLAPSSGNSVSYNSD